MNLFEFSPKKNTQKLALVTGLLIIGAAVLMIITMIFDDMAYRWAIQLLSLGMLTMGIFITTRYVMKSYIYAVIRNDDGEEDFTVTEIQGKRKITVCRIGMSSVEQVFSVTQGDKQAELEIKAKVKDGKYKKFNYCGDLFDEKHLYIFANECGEAFSIKLSYDEGLEKLFEIKEENQEQ